MDDDAPIDPRIHARRIAVQQERTRRRSRVLVVVAVVVVVAALAYLTVESPVLDVDQVRVVGARHLGVEEVRAAAAVETGTALLRVDTGAVAARVETLGWVEDARVSRDLPGTLRIEVTEHTPAAYARRPDGSVALLASDGRVIGDAVEAPGDIPEVLGARRVPAAGDVLTPPVAAGIVDRLPVALASQVRAVDAGGDEFVLVLAPGGRVRLGDDSDLEAKAAAALAVLERLAGQPLDYVDVQVPEAPVARVVE